MKRFPRYPANPHTSGQARIVICGKHYYLGEFDSDQSWRKYNRLREEWQQTQKSQTIFNPSDSALSVSDLVKRYTAHLNSYYTDEAGNQSTEVRNWPFSIKPFLELCGDLLGAEITAKHLKQFQTSLLTRACRKTINQYTSRIKRMFKWCASEELIPIAVYQKVATVEGLRRGRSQVKDYPEVKPVEVDLVMKTLPFLWETVQAMVLTGLYTGMRPGEICRLHRDEFDTFGIEIDGIRVWLYHPQKHKTAYRGHAKTICIGPKAQEVLEPYLEKSEGFLFVGQKGRPTQHFQPNTLYQGICKACAKANLPKWTPNQLRHTAAYNATHAFDLDAARALLGHKDAQITERYSGRDLLKAAQVAAKLG